MVDLADSSLQARIAGLFPKDTAAEGGSARLAELQRMANEPFTTDNEAGRKSEHARHLMKLGREYRRALMGSVAS